ncbi:sarcosine oxidase subunit gamma [Pseudonocardia humida]|uniref:Sarcosine oxidase subunit gamma n=1 Tax=Pseudonocardia humida TaxID=2800819 RepID=A0ABT0ZXN4_9PSEU|nr:sarcosine oxidase subunit gamma family protein [Pseudonocardia humida]MCO1655458.1 sarcosine oxidase subunit gamma [Pseudonocardia humida]
MADTLHRSPVLRHREDAFARLPEGLEIVAEPDVALADLRVPEGAVASATGVVGVALPLEPNTWVARPGGQVVWLGPDEWLVSDADERPEALEAALRAAVAPHDGAAVDVSAQRTAVRLRGRHARALLATGCALDLHPSVFGAGRSAQTTLGLVGVVLLALDDRGEDYRILVRPSFAGYLADWLLDAAVEFEPPGPAAAL